MFTLWILIIAPFVGSFLGVVVTRFETPDSALTGRSKCPHCQHKLSGRDLVPLLSWLMLRGKCRHCGADISRIYLVCEAGAFLIALWVILVVDAASVVPGVVLGWTLLTISLIDIGSLRIPNFLSGGVLVSGLLTTAVLFWSSMANHVGGVAAGFSILFITRHAWFRLRGVQGLGRADERLLAAGGAWVGVTGVFSSLFLASLLGLASVAIATLLGKTVKASDKLPFGPLLAAGVWLTWLYGPLF